MQGQPELVEAADLHGSKVLDVLEVSEDQALVQLRGGGHVLVAFVDGWVQISTVVYERGDWPCSIHEALVLGMRLNERVLGARVAVSDGDLEIVCDIYPGSATLDLAETVASQVHAVGLATRSLLEQLSAKSTQPTDEEIDAAFD